MALWVIFILMLTSAAILIGGFLHGLKPYTISSMGALTLDEKLQRIDPHYKLPSKVDDIEYYCEVYPSSIGPSHHRDVIVAKVAPEDVEKWLVNYYHVEAYDGETEASDGRRLFETIVQSSGIALEKNIWKHSSEPKVYAFNSNDIIVFLPECILLLQCLK